MEKQKTVMGFILLLFVVGVRAWTGEIHGRVVCDVCGDSSLGPEDHVVEGFPLALFNRRFVSIFCRFDRVSKMVFSFFDESCLLFAVVN